jgi:stage II sporulation protein P
MDRQLLAFGKLLGLLAAGTFTLIVVIGFAAWVHGKLQSSPNEALMDMTGAIPQDVLIELLAAEVGDLRHGEEQEGSKAGKASKQLIKILTGIDPADPRSVLAAEISGLAAGSEAATGDREAMDMVGAPGDRAPSPGDPLPGLDVEPSPPATGQVETQQPAAEGGELPELDIPVSAGMEERQRVKVFIYHSHNRESWVPELEGVKHPNDAYDEEINITLLGKRLAERLEEDGIGVKVSDKDYPSVIKDFNYNHSYSYSLKTVQEASITYPELQYYFDIHRDSQKRSLTTATIDGVDYAQVYFIIGKQNPNWRENEAFAQRIHDRLEEKYPGLSRGILGKNAKTGNGEYNQHISPNAILIEVGGPENTLEESYRTIDVLAEVLSELFWDAEKVNAPLEPGEVVAAAAQVNERKVHE